MKGASRHVSSRTIQKIFPVLPKGRGGIATQSFVAAVAVVPGADLALFDRDLTGVQFDGQVLTVHGPITARVVNHGPDAVTQPFDVTFFEDANASGGFDSTDTILARRG